MTSKTVLFDTWAWFEVLKGTPTGLQLRRHLEREDTVVITADVSLVEASSKLARTGKAAEIDRVLDDIIASSDEVVPISRADAARAGPLLVELRKVDADASLVDATLLSMARNRGALLMSCDPAFQGQPDVVCEGDRAPSPSRRKRR